MPLGNKVRSLQWQLPLSYAIRTLKTVLFFLYVFLNVFFSLQLFYCFDPKWFVWLSAGWNLNAADWNLNCDLAAANCESAAELPIKPFSSLHFRFLFVGWFISLYHFVCLGFCYFKSSDQPFQLPYVLEIF